LTKDLDEMDDQNKKAILTKTERDSMLKVIHKKKDGMKQLQDRYVKLQQLIREVRA